ncbi:MAG: excinuclease ABC subunit UvrC [Rhodospirillales bacterium]|nr:excinuclease ABC subunit UvrC [Rhodospirillales bacterium]
MGFSTTDGSLNNPDVPTLRGAAVIDACLQRLPSSPGVYRMMADDGGVLYVGKARSLKKRVATYASPGRLGPRLQRMIAETASMEFVTTHTEAEALLLESNLIKRLQPRYNILLRDDKSFSSILVTGDQTFARVLKHRGAQSRKGEYFGPFASTWAVNRTLTALQRAFLLRTCSDAVFAARTRPCLLYQIKRCSAPCVGRVSAEAYAGMVDEARAFLKGNSQRVQEDLARRMEKASESLDFEEAAKYRDRIRALTAVQSHQDINLEGVGDADVIVVAQSGASFCVQVFFFRGGCNYGNRAYYPDHAAGELPEVVLEAFVGQFYDQRTPPPLVLLSHVLPNQDLVQEALSLRAERRVAMAVPQRGSKHNLVRHALDNAQEALARRIGESASQRRHLEGLARLLDLETVPERIEVYDNSHVGGSEAMGAMIVAGPDGLIKGAYRKFRIRNLAGAAKGDDYAMMREVLTRRFARAQNEDAERSQGQWPDLVLVDGGAGQLGVARQILSDLGAHEITVAGIAKGPDRNAGRERIFLADRPPLQPDARDPVLHYLQRLRDEAHRFAIGSHRARRSAKIAVSALDEIPGIGPSRKKGLLHHFGSARAVEQAGLADLEAAPGISHAIAKKIYDWFHPER